MVHSELVWVRSAEASVVWGSLDSIYGITVSPLYLARSVDSESTKLFIVYAIRPAEPTRELE